MVEGHLRTEPNRPYTQHMLRQRLQEHRNRWWLLWVLMPFGCVDNDANEPVQTPDCPNAGCTVAADFDVLDRRLGDSRQPRDGAVSTDQPNDVGVNEQNVIDGCELREPICIDSFTLSFCAADNTSQTERCPDGRWCDSGRCVAQICEPNTQVCDELTLRRCNEFGSGYLDAADLDCSTLNQVCEIDRCVEPGPNTAMDCRTLDCLSERDRAQVCDRYVANVLTTANAPFISGEAQCDPGTLTSEGYAEALSVLNYGRWLSGLSPVQFDASLHEGAQLCATMMANERRLSHDPDETFACYDTRGAYSASKSNLHMSSGNESIVDSVMGFFHDGGNNNLTDVGHRRWFLSNRLTLVGFGFHHSTTTGYSSSCYDVISGPRGAFDGPEIVMYPAPGPFPIHMLTSRFWRLPWSVQVDADYGARLDNIDQWTVEVWRLENGAPQLIELDSVSSSDRWYGWSQGIVFRPAERPEVGRYRISIRGPQFETEWETELIECDF